MSSKINFLGYMMLTSLLVLLLLKSNLIATFAYGDSALDLTIATGVMVIAEVITLSVAVILFALAEIAKMLEDIE